jgi:hypothetical protein
MNEKDFTDNLDACGKAFGFALAMAFKDGSNLHTPAGQLEFAGHFSAMLESEMFSPDVSCVLQGVVDGLTAAAKPRPTPLGEIL